MHARNLARHPRASLVSVFDVMPAAAQETAAELGVPAAGSVEDVLADSNVQAVLIASPTDTHVPLIIAAAKAGKAVLCEKPIDLDMARVQACRQEIAPLKPTVMIGFNRRFDPSFRALRDRLHAGEVGKLELLLITSRDPAPPPASYIAGSGGLFRDMTIHDFDMARFLAGPIVEVHAFGANLIDPAIQAAGDIDAAMVTLRASSGALVHINNARRAAYGYDQRLEAFGAKGMLQALNRHATTVQAWTEERSAAGDPALHFFIERYQDAYAAEIDHFVQCVTQSTAPSPGFDDGLAALQLADAALESLRSGRVVRLDG
jgi:myo-inositol 2-dehydrogenase/D-chiro-inositol 1-dehydrogenase